MIIITEFKLMMNASECQDTKEVQSRFHIQHLRIACLVDVLMHVYLHIDMNLYI